MISSPQLKGHRYVRSLTTLATPHWGSPAAEWAVRWLRLPPRSRPSRIRGLIGKDLRYLLDVLYPFDGILPQMTGESLVEFNRTYPNRPGITYWSYAAAAGPGEEDDSLPLPLKFFQRLIFKDPRPRLGERNDGQVSVGSARGGGLGKPRHQFRFKGVLPADHFQINGHDWSLAGRWKTRFLGKRPPFDHLSFYVNTVRNLQRL